MSLFQANRIFLVPSSFMMWAWPFCEKEIFSLALLSWIPTLVTPMGHGEFPMERWT